MARNSGNGSYYDLLNIAYQINNLPNIGVESAKLDSNLKITPISFLRSGRYFHETGERNIRNSYGHYFESFIEESRYARYLVFGPGGITLRGSTNKGTGFSVRWGDKSML